MEKLISEFDSLGLVMYAKGGLLVVNNPNYPKWKGIRFLGNKEDVNIIVKLLTKSIKDWQEYLKYEL
jgi:hypothetical protein